MQLFRAGSANVVSLDMVKKADGSAIDSGTVNFYLKALTGSNAGKWWNAALAAWEASEVSSGVASYSNGDSEWTCSIVAGAWTSNVRYSVYGKESGDLHIPYTDVVEDVMFHTSYGSGSVSWDYVLTDSVTSAVIVGANVLVSTDESGLNMIRSGVTNTLGTVTFNLNPGTYYIWSYKSGYTFTNPDTEVVS